MAKYNIHEVQLLNLLSRVNLTQLEISEIHNLLPKVNDWTKFYELCELNRYSTFVYSQIQKLALENHLTEHSLELFENQYKKIKRNNQNRLDEAVKFIKLFNEKEIEVVILKGIYYAEVFYKNPYYKRMNDVDILVHREDLDKIFEVYNKLDYFSAGELLGKSAREHDEFSHHLPPFFSKNLYLMIGTHWELHTPLRPYRLNYSKIWSRVVTFDFYGCDVKALSIVDNLHHLCVHLSFFKAGAREVGDIVNLVRFTISEIDWNDFITDVKEAKSYNQVYMAIGLANIMDPRSEYQFVMEQLRPLVKNKTIKLLREKSKSLEIFFTTRSAHITTVDKAFTNFKSTKKGLEKLKFYLLMWKNILFPPAAEVFRITNTTPNLINLIIGRLKAPIRIMSSLCDDLGTKIFILLTLYTFYKTLLTLATSPFSSNSEDQSAYAEKLGITLDQLKDLQDRLE